MIYDEPGEILINEKFYRFPSGAGGFVESLESIKMAKNFYCCPNTTIPDCVSIIGDAFLSYVSFFSSGDKKINIKNSYINSSTINGEIEIINSNISDSICEYSSVKNASADDCIVRYSNLQSVTAKSCVFFSVLSERSEFVSTFANSTKIRDSFLVNFEVELGEVNFVNSLFTSARVLTNPNILCRLDFVECGSRYAFRTLDSEKWAYIPAVWQEGIPIEEVIQENILYFDTLPQKEFRKIDLKKEPCCVRYLCSKDFDKITMLPTKFINALSNFSSCVLPITKWVDWFVIYEFFLVECLLDVLSVCDNRKDSNDDFIVNKERIKEDMANKLTLNIKNNDLSGRACFIDTRTKDYLKKFAGFNDTVFSSFIKVVNNVK